MVAERSISGIALKIGIAGVVSFGALATGMIVSRKGRHLLREAWQGRQRTTLEDRVLEALWSDSTLSRRTLDVEEVADGTIVLTGEVHNERERRLALVIAERARGVHGIVNRLDVVAPAPRRRTRAAARIRQVRDSGVSPSA
jgi:hypothetical protein